MKKVSLLAVSMFLLAVLAAPLEAQNPGMVKDIYPGSASAFSSSDKTWTRDVLNGTLFISADNGSTGQEIFKSAPPFIEATTGLVKDMTPGTSGVSTNYHAAYDKLFFVSPATIDINGWYQGLCRSDGTTQGTSLLYAAAVKKNISWRIREIESSQGGIFSAGYSTRLGNPVMDNTGFLYKTDPTTGVSVQLKTISGNFFRLTSVNGTLVCEAWDKGHTLYRSNGTARGTVAYYNLPLDGIDTPSPYPVSPHPYYMFKTFYVGGNNLFFECNDGGFGSELWKTDGTTVGTLRVTDINPGTAHGGPAMCAVMNSYLYFSANDGVHGWQVWRYPVSGTGTAERVTDIDGGAVGADPMWLTAMGNTLFFSAFTEANGRELWKSNGLPTGNGGVFSRVSDINPGSGSSNPNYAATSVTGIAANIKDTDKKFKYHMAVLGDWVYFPADDGSGYALWRSDGTTTEKLGAINPHRLTPVSWMENTQPRDMLLFIAWTEIEGYELWKFDPAAPIAPKGNSGQSAPSGLSLHQNYPNPFNPSTLITYEIPEAAHVRLAVYDVYGRKVATLVDCERLAGQSSAEFHAGDLPSGMYTYILEAGGAVLSKVMALVK